MVPRVHLIRRNRKRSNRLGGWGDIDVLETQIVFPSMSLYLDASRPLVELYVQVSVGEREPYVPGLHDSSCGGDP